MPSRTRDGASQECVFRQAIERNADDGVTDLHVWQVGPNHLSAAVSVVTRHARTPEYYKNLLHGVPRLAHVLVEVNPCHGRPGVPCGGTVTQAR